MTPRFFLPLVVAALSLPAVAAPLIVTHNLSSLRGMGNLAFTFSLVDGSLTGNGNARVRVSNLSLVGGVLDGSSTLGAVTGSPENTLLLSDDTGSVSEYTRDIRASSSRTLLRFTVDFESDSFETVTPDMFSYTLLRDGDVVATDGPTGAEYASFTFGPDATLLAHASTEAGRPPAPTMAPVPEPASMAVLGLGLAILRRRRKAV